jgi:hypothetical protein
MTTPLLVLPISGGLTGILSGGGQGHQDAGARWSVWYKARCEALVAAVCLSFFIASGSFFLGRQKVFPAEWRGATIWVVQGFCH